MDTLFILMTVTQLTVFSQGSKGPTGVQYSPLMTYQECVKAKELADQCGVRTKMIKIIRKKDSK